jgi:hypothetical protein
MNFYRIGQEIIEMKIKLMSYVGDEMKNEWELLEDCYISLVEYYLKSCKLYQEEPCEKVMAYVNR